MDEQPQKQTPSVLEKLGVPPERERNIKEKKTGYEYFIVVINYRPGLKFGLGIKNVYKNIFVIKTDENSIVSGLFNVADRIIDVDGEPVFDNAKCKMLLVKALKERKTASLLIERGITEKAIKEATDEMNEEHNQSVMAAPDVRSIMRKMELRIRKSPSVENCTPIPSAMTKKDGGKVERKAIVVEDGHKSVMIRMDNEENRDKLQKVAKKPEPPKKVEEPPKQPVLTNMIAPAAATTPPSGPSDEASCEPGQQNEKKQSKEAPQKN